MTEDEAKAVLAARVSRETLARLQTYADLLVKWQKTINLVAPSTLPQLWSRHILDSAQLMAQVPPQATRWLDLGSGGGFPGLVCAAIAGETQPRLHLSLVESDQRKAAFLREAARQMGLAVTVIARRIEDLPPTPSDIISARALAPLAQLCAHAAPHLVSGGICLFQKGARHAEELATARQGWHMNCTAIPSVTDAEAVILRIEQLSHA